MSPSDAPSRRNFSLLLLLLLASITAAFYRLAHTELYQIQYSEVEGAALFEPAATPIWIALGAALWSFLVRQRRLEAALHQPGSPVLTAILLVPAVALYFWSHYVSALDLLLLDLPLTLLAVGAALGGLQLCRILLVPVVFLLFAFHPPGVVLNTIIFPLQLATANFSTFLLNAIQVEAHQLSDLIFTGGRVFQVIETCSGLRSMETLLLAGLLYTELFPSSSTQRYLVLLSMPILSFALNGIRILSIALDPDQTTHTTQGIVVIVVGVLCTAAIHSGLGRLFPPPKVRRPVSPGNFRSRTVYSLSGFFFLLTALSFVVPRWDDTASRKYLPLLRFPMNLGEWKGRANKLDRPFLGTVDYTQYLRYEFSREGDSVDLFLGIDDFRNRTKSFVSPKTIPFESGVRVISSRAVHLSDSHPNATLSLIQTSRDRKFNLVCHWTEKTKSLSSEILRSLGALDQSPFARSESARLVRLSTPLGGPTPSDPREHERALALIREVVALYDDAIEQLEASQDTDALGPDFAP